MTAINLDETQPGYKRAPVRNPAGDYVAYWRYVVDRFRRADVTNVAWVWCVNGDRSGGKDWPDYYPGDDYVDWLAIDVYSSRNPREVIQQFPDLYGRKGKPVMIPAGGTGPEQTRWNTQYAEDAASVIGVHAGAAPRAGVPRGRSRSRGTRCYQAAVDPHCLQHG